MTTQIVILAAGMGSRLGRSLPKPLTELSDGRSIMHCQLQIGDSMILLHDEYAESGGESPQSLEGSPVTLHLFVDDADVAFERAIKAGAKVDKPLENLFWGDRYGQLTAPFGHHWSIAHRITDLSPEQIRKGAAEYFKG